MKQNLCKPSQSAYLGGHFTLSDTPLTVMFFSFYLRVALGTAYLSSVADRFGIWGASGNSNVFWGSFRNFVDYTGKLNPHCPDELILPLSWGVTGIEVLLGICLVLGIYLRQMAFASGVMLFLFTLGQMAGVGVKAALDYSVYTASAASFLLATQCFSLFSFDNWMLHKNCKVSVKSSSEKEI